MGSGLFCGFITASTVGLGYFFVVSSFLKKDIQKRVAAMTGYGTVRDVPIDLCWAAPSSIGSTS